MNIKDALMYVENHVRQVVLDTETTGMNKDDQPHYIGHRIIEIGAVEIINRRFTNRYFHTYLNPNRSIDLEAFNIHGINENFLNDKPMFSEIANDFLNFISGSELIIHNAPFDIAFIDYEFSMLKLFTKKLTCICKIIDTLQLARKLFPGKRNSLDALCERYCIDNTVRSSHNALLDAKLLANVFLLMTGGQIAMSFMEDINEFHFNSNHNIKDIEGLSCIMNSVLKPSINVIYANSDEIADHDLYLDVLEKNNGGFCIWRNKYKVFK